MKTHQLVIVCLASIIGLFLIVGGALWATLDSDHQQTLQKQACAAQGGSSIYVGDDQLSCQLTKASR